MAMGIVFAADVLTAGRADGLLYILPLNSHIHSLLLSAKLRASEKKVTSTDSIWGSVGQIAGRRNLKELLLMCSQTYCGSRALC